MITKYACTYIRAHLTHAAHTDIIHSSTHALHAVAYQTCHTQHSIPAPTLIRGFVSRYYSLPLHLSMYSCDGLSQGSSQLLVSG